MEPWDGPAGIVLTDGRYAACALDRNGLRPARYLMTKDRHVTLASEIGVYDYDQKDVIKKGRLAPGEMLAVDIEKGQLLLTDDIDHILKDRHPYLSWLKKYSAKTPPYNNKEEHPLNFETNELLTYKKTFSVTFEEEKEIIAPLAEIGQEATGSMGDDTPMPVIYSQVWSPLPSITAVHPELRTPNLSPAIPSANSLPPVAPYKHVFPIMIISSADFFISSGALIIIFPPAMPLPT
tara:strand:- start:30 stop:737 length:708 start_codon:yes stop_codon:yes gene_type:complete